MVPRWNLRLLMTWIVRYDMLMCCIVTPVPPRQYQCLALFELRNR